MGERERDGSVSSSQDVIVSTLKAAESTERETFTEKIRCNTSNDTAGKNEYKRVQWARWPPSAVHAGERERERQVESDEMRWMYREDEATTVHERYYDACASRTLANGDHMQRHHNGRERRRESKREESRIRREEKSAKADTQLSGV